MANEFCRVWLICRSRGLIRHGANNAIYTKEILTIFWWPVNFVGKFDTNLSGAHCSGPIEVGPHHGSTATITIADANLLFTGDFKRSGPDLVLSKDGHDLVVQDYFRGAT